MNFIYYSLTPTQAYQRIAELSEKEKDSALSKLEKEELEELKEVFLESNTDFEF
ncbi:hypothetical protein [Chondrinema litorale]|uniref:hypothetical protein n=1 Tax=Chondrinema litorale TaxID=2994555 RepID=UPI0025430886|nr:hypothetical protein [Chondrinema litorale]UZR95737.1 hypothetical protein OQ292_07920 [Chondrinema litorale]